MSAIEVCRDTRAIAAKTLEATLTHLFAEESQISETSLRDTWLSELRKEQTIFPDGWYVPPPHGIGVLFGHGRQNYESLRPENMWPKDSIYLGKDKIAYLFASPVDRETGIIGDFGLTIYGGKDPAIQEHLKNCFAVNKAMVDFMEVGKKFSDVFSYAEKIIAERGLTNEVTSTTDRTGVNFGHTIPGTYPLWTEEEQARFINAESDWQELANMISKKRIFVNQVEETTYKPGMAVTLEPRLTVIDQPDIPMGSFHTIVIFKENGSKELLTNFDEIFRLVGMEYMF